LHPCFSSKVEFDIVAEGAPTGEVAARVVSTVNMRRVTASLMFRRKVEEKSCSVQTFVVFGG